MFELSPPTVQGSTWSESILYTFDTFGLGPMGGLIFDQAGNLYGTTAEGPGVSGNFLGGIAFELSPPAQTGGTWTETTLYAMNDYADDPGSYAGLVFDRSGDLWGTSVSWPGGQSSVFRLIRPETSNGAWIAASIGVRGASDRAAELGLCWRALQHHSARRCRQLQFRQFLWLWHGVLGSSLICP